MYVAERQEADATISVDRKLQASSFPIAVGSKPCL